MIETALVSWAYRYHNGTTTSFSGHVMSEVYVGNKWVLLDNDGSYVYDYDPLNPYINTRNGDGYFVYAGTGMRYYNIEVSEFATLIIF